MQISDFSSSDCVDGKAVEGGGVLNKALVLARGSLRCLVVIQLGDLGEVSLEEHDIFWKRVHGDQKGMCPEPWAVLKP